MLSDRKRPTPPVARGEGRCSIRLIAVPLPLFPMKIPLPNKLLNRIERWYAPIGDWLNVPIYKRVRRIDVAIVILGIVCVGYYWVTTGWQGALMSGLMFIFGIMLALWIF